MIDGSHEPFEKNVEICKRVVDYAHKHNCVVEGELGMLVGAAREVGRHWARQNPDDAVLLRGALRRVRAEVRDATLRRSRSATGGDGAGA